MALFNSRNQLFSGNRFYIVVSAFVKPEFHRFSISFGQICNNIFFSFHYAVFIAHIQDLACRTGDGDNIFRTKFYPSRIANTLLNSLIKFGIGNAIFFTFNHSIRAFAFIITEYNNICPVSRQTVRDGNLQVNPVGRVFVFVNQFSIKFSTYLFFRIAEIIFIIVGTDVSNLDFSIFFGE